MKKSQSPAYHIGLLLLRIAFSAAMLTHGIPKLEKLISGNAVKFANLWGLGETATLVLAVVGEVLFPILVILGFRTRLSAFPVAITMGIAAFVIHAGDTFHDREMALLYFAAFLVLVFTGGGKYGIDSIVKKKNKRKTF
jgi:putative oxidoreductase